MIKSMKARGTKNWLVSPSFALGRLIRNRWLYAMLLPGLLYFLIFKYWPMYGIFIAFKDYQPFLGFWESPFVGFKHFERLFSESNFLMLFRNTLILAAYNILFFFPLPIIIALMLNELRVEFKANDSNIDLYSALYVLGRSRRDRLHLFNDRRRADQRTAGAARWRKS